LIAKLLRLIGAGALILAGSAAIAWPLWALATRYRRLYTALFGLGLLLLVTAAVLSKIRRARKPRRKRP
jgi:hypothetical protein